MALLVLHAGREWLYDINPQEAASEIASWLGPWARICPQKKRMLDCAGRIAMSAAAEPRNSQLGVTRGASGIEVSAENFTVTFRAGGPPASGEVTFRPGYAVNAMQSALRLVAMYRLFTEGGLAVHASSVRADGRALLFAGAAGTGKTTAAQAFPSIDRLDDDLVFVAERSGEWVRLESFDPQAPRRFGPGDVGELPVQALLLPGAAQSFRAELLESAEAVRACLHMPPPGLLPESPGDAVSAARVLSSASRLASQVSVVRFGWAPGEDLPSLLREFLRGCDARET